MLSQPLIPHVCFVMASPSGQSPSLAFDSGPDRGRATLEVGESVIKRTRLSTPRARTGCQTCKYDGTLCSTAAFAHPYIGLEESNATRLSHFAKDVLSLGVNVMGMLFKPQPERAVAVRHCWRLEVPPPRELRLQPPQMHMPSRSRSQAARKIVGSSITSASKSRPNSRATAP